jgi:hypothetical protein
MQGDKSDHRHHGAAGSSPNGMDGVAAPMPANTLPMMTGHLSVRAD